MKQVKKNKQVPIQDIFALGAYAFHFQDSLKDEFNLLGENSFRYGIYENSIKAGLLGTKFSVQVEDATIPMVGVGCVATFPEARKKGYVKQLFQELFQDMKSQQISLSYLAPFSYSFYEKFGYHKSFSTLESSVALSNIKPSLENSGEIVRLSYEEARPYLQKIYEENERTHHFAIRRDAWWWEYLYKGKEKQHFAVCFNKKEPFGYMVYELNKEQFLVKELSFIKTAAAQELMNFIASHQASCQTVHFSGLSHFSAVNQFLKEPVSLMKKPYMMARIVDCATFFSQMPFPKCSSFEAFYLEIEDENCLWNQGFWQVSSVNETLTFTKVEQPDNSRILKGNIGMFTAFFLGEEPMKDLITFEKIVGNRELGNLLEKLVKQEKPKLFDFF